MKKNTYLIITLLSLSLFLITMAFYTIDSTYANPNIISSNTWDIYFNNANKKIEDNNNISILNNRLDIFATLNNENKSYEYQVDINNLGSYDAYLENLNISGLNNNEIGVISSKVYYLKDLIDVNLSYAEYNNVNNIVFNKTVTVGDLLRVDTSNKITIKINVKENLTEEELELLNNVLEKSINLKISIEAIYKEA